MMKRLFALLLSLALLVSVSAAFAEEASDTLLVTVNGYEIRENNEELQYYLSDVLAGQENPDEETLHIARMYAMTQVIEGRLIADKTAAAFTEDEVAVIKDEARKEWNEYVEQIMADEYGITADSSEEDKNAARAEVLSLLEMYYGYTEETYVDSAVSRAFSEKVINDLKAANPDLAATDEEVETAYADLVKEEMEGIGEDVAMYEFYQNYGYDLHFVPEGYRGIIHILIPVDEELLANYNSLNARLEENSEPLEATGTDGAPAVTPEPVTPEMVETARQAILDSKKDTVDEIMGRLANGESFQALIIEYGTDPGMLNEDAAIAFMQGTPISELQAQYGDGLLGENAKKGYYVHKDSIAYYPVFTEAAAKLEKVGDVSEPVVSSKGIHILYYLCDVPAGPMEMTDDIRAQMRDSIESERLDLAISDMLLEWEAEADIVWTAEGEAWKYDEEAVEAYQASMAEASLEDDSEEVTEEAPEETTEAAPAEEPAEAAAP